MDARRIDLGMWAHFLGTVTRKRFVRFRIYRGVRRTLH